MSKKNKSYWEGRHTQWLNNQTAMDDKVADRLKKEYQRTANSLEKDIASYFQRYGQDNVIEFRTMMQDLSDSDKNLLFQNMEKFATKYPEHAHLMPVRESVYRLNRLQGLHYSTQMQLLELGAIEQGALEKHLESTYGKRYGQMMKELGVGSQFLSIDSQLMRDTIFSKWVDGKNFSDRIWDNKEKLLNQLQTRYRDGLAAGLNYDALAKEIEERFDVGAHDARRLVWTEGNFVLNQSHVQAYQSADVKVYEISAIMDSRTSQICNDLDGKVFSFDEMEVGVNFPPFHPFCRTTFIGLLDELLSDSDEEINAYEHLPITDDNLGDEERIEQAINRTKELVEGYEQETGVNVVELWKSKKFGDRSNPYDDEHAKFAEYMINKLGYDGLPTEIDDVGDLLPMYRGIVDFEDGSVTSSDLMERFMTGQFDISGHKSSAFGRGAYFGLSESTASDYASQGKNGKLITAYLKEDAKILDHKHIKAQTAYIKKHSDELAERFGDDFEFYKFSLDKTSFMDRNYEIFAMTHGYDGIHAVGAGTYEVIFNRAALGVKK